MSDHDENIRYWANRYVEFFPDAKGNKHITDLLAEADALTAANKRVAELEPDSKRMDYLIKTEGWRTWYDSFNIFVASMPESDRAIAIREAIDAAMNSHPASKPE
jgi:hypothetical protein